MQELEETTLKTWATDTKPWVLASDFEYARQSTKLLVSQDSKLYRRTPKNSDTRKNIL